MTNEDWIFWSKDRLITWDDFQGETKVDSTHYAETSNKIHYQWAIKYREDKPKMQFTDFEVKAVFVKSESWKQNYSANYPEITLKHEQGHFDIAEEFSRKFKKILMNELLNRTFSFKIIENESIKNCADAEAKKIIKEIYEREEIEYKKEHVSYDNETKHGTILKLQEEYNQRFDKLRN